MMTSLKERVLSLVSAYLEDDSMEAGYNSTTIEDDGLEIDVECYNDIEVEMQYGGYDEEPYCEGTGRIIPKMVMVYPLDEEGECACSYDMTKEFEVYEFRF